MLYDNDNDIPTSARILIDQSVTRYNNNLRKFTSGWEKYILPLFTSGAVTALIGWSASLQVIVTAGLYCILNVICLTFAYLYPYLDSPIYILDNTTMAAFFASFHGEMEKDIAALPINGDLWKKLCSKYEIREQKQDSRKMSKNGLIRAMAIDGIAMLFHIKNY